MGELDIALLILFSMWLGFYLLAKLLPGIFEFNLKPRRKTAILTELFFPRRRNTLNPDDNHNNSDGSE